MFDFMKRKKNNQPDYPQEPDYGSTIPLVPGHENPQGGSVEIPVPTWNGPDSDDWYGPAGGGFGIPMDMPAGIPAMPDPGDATVCEPQYSPPQPEFSADATISEDLRYPQPQQDYGSTIPLVQESATVAGNSFGQQQPGFVPVDYEPTVGLPPVAVGQGDFVRVDTYTGPSLVCTKGALEGKRFAFRTAVLTLGVDYSCDVVLPLGTPGISRRHLRFWLDGQTPWAMDLKSTYGSFLNGEKMKPGLAYVLKPGDQFKLGGDEQFRVE